MVTLANMLKGGSDERRRHADTEARTAAGLQAARASLAAASEERLARIQACGCGRGASHVCKRT